MSKGRRFKENVIENVTYTYNQKERVGLFGIHNEEIELGEIGTHRTY